MRISDWSSDVCSSDLIAGLMRAGLTTIHAQACMQTVDLICQPTLGAQRFLLRGILYCRVGAQQPARRRSSIAFGRFDHRTCQLPRRRPTPEPSRKAIIGRAEAPALVVGTHTLP